MSGPEHVGALSGDPGNPGPSSGNAGQIPDDIAARNRILYEHFRVSEELQLARIQAKYRQEAEEIYNFMAEPFGDSIKVNGGLFSPAKLKELASEALRHKIFVEEWIDAGGRNCFNKGHRFKFDRDVLKRIFEEDFPGFDLRITQWLALNPRPKFPALPEAVSSDASSTVTVGSLNYDPWTIEEEVRKHRYYAGSPDQTGNPDVDAESDDSVVILHEKKKTSE